MPEMNVRMETEIEILQCSIYWHDCSCDNQGQCHLFCAQLPLVGQHTFRLTIRLQEGHDLYSINERNSLEYIRYVCAILFCDNKRIPRFNEITLLTIPSSWDEMPSIMKRLTSVDDFIQVIL